MNPEDLIGKYVTKCCVDDMRQVSTIAEAAEVIEWNAEMEDDCPSMMYQFADTIEQAKLMWTPHESVGG